MRIVVGIDGSEPALKALGWAAEQARLTGASLEVVWAWAYPPSAIVPGAPALPIPPEEMDALVQAEVDRVIEATLGADPDVDIATTIGRGDPASELLERSRHADLLVVGTRGMGGFKGLLLGSVSQHVLHHAACPVVVVPGDSRRNGER